MLNVYKCRRSPGLYINHLKRKSRPHTATSLRKHCCYKLGAVTYWNEHKITSPCFRSTHGTVDKKWGKVHRSRKILVIRNLAVRDARPVQFQTRQRAGVDSLQRRTATDALAPTRWRRRQTGNRMTQLSPRVHEKFIVIYRLNGTGSHSCSNCGFVKSRTTIGLLWLGNK